MLGELRPKCLDKYIQASVSPCWADRLAQGECGKISRISRGQPLANPFFLLIWRS